jgi:hypothetical protein
MAERVFRRWTNDELRLSVKTYCAAAGDLLLQQAKGERFLSLENSFNLY